MYSFLKAFLVLMKLFIIVFIVPDGASALVCVTMHVYVYAVI